MLMHYYVIELTSRRFFIMDATDYWPFAQEYPIWNAVVTVLQFWMDNLDPPISMGHRHAILGCNCPIIDWGN